MKEDIDIILRHLDCYDDEILTLQEEILKLDLSHPHEIELALEDLHNIIAQPNLEIHYHLGYYCFFSDCVYYEKEEYINVIKGLESTTIPQLQETNKSLAYWLLGISYSHLKEPSMAQDALKEALDILRLRTNQEINTYSPQKQYDQRTHIREKINKTLENIQNSTSSLTNKPMHYLTSTNLFHSKKKESFWGREKEDEKQDNSADALNLTENGLFPKDKPIPKISSQSASENKSNIQHIVVPVDISALDDEQLKAMPLDHVLFNKLESYNRTRRNK